MTTISPDRTAFLPAPPGSKPGLKLIACGLGRSGTSSLAVALNELGVGPSHHLASVVTDPSRAKLWLKAWDATFESKGEMTKADWDELLDGYWAVMDVPACLFADVLAEHYPDAKIVINYREFPSWSASIMKTIFALPNLPTVVRYLDWPRRQMWELFIKMHTHPNFNMALAIRSPHPEKVLRRFYDAHYAYMEKVLPAERTIWWRVQDGWGPLCEHLGVPVPERPFPHAYDSKAFAERQRANQARFKRTAYANLMGVLSVVAAAVAAPFAYRAVAGSF